MRPAAAAQTGIAARRAAKSCCEIERQVVVALQVAQLAGPRGGDGRAELMRREHQPKTTGERAPK